MKKYLLRILIALFTFFGGIVSVNFIDLSNVKVDLPESTMVEQIKSDKTVYPTDSKGKIEVRFKNYGRIKKQTSLIFEIINHNTQPVKYSYTRPYVKFNNREEEVFICGTGMKELEIEPGSSITVEFIAAHFLYEYLDKKGQFQIGYFFKKGKNQYKKIWSEKFSVSDEMKREIISKYPDG